MFGTLIIATLPELLRSASQHLDGVYGIVIILVVLFMPNGIYGTLRNAVSSVKIKAALKKAGTAEKGGE